MVRWNHESVLETIVKETIEHRTVHHSYTVLCSTQYRPFASSGSCTVSIRSAQCALTRGFFALCWLSCFFFAYVFHFNKAVIEPKRNRHENNYYHTALYTKTGKDMKPSDTRTPESFLITKGFINTPYSY